MLDTADDDVQGAGTVVEGHPHRAPEGPQVGYRARGDKSHFKFPLRMGRGGTVH